MREDAGRMPVAPLDVHGVAAHRPNFHGLDGGIHSRRRVAAGRARARPPQIAPAVDALVPIGPKDLDGRFTQAFDPLRFECFGHDMITHSMDIAGCVESVLKKAGMLKDFPRAFLSVTGPDRTRFLHNVLTHDIKGLSVGQGRPACMLDRQGKIRFLAFVHAQPEKLILEMEKGSLPIALQELNRYLISDKAKIKDESRSFRVVALHGPGAAEVLARVFPSLTLPETNLGNGSPPNISGIESILRWDLFGVSGYHLWVSPRAEEEVRGKLLTAGKDGALEEISGEAFHVLRIMRGIPWPGAEIDENVILNELGQNEELASFTKGCYVGQEIVARIKYRAHPPRLLKGFSISGSNLPSTRSPLILESKPVGILTSCCFSPTLNQVIALGFLNYGVEETHFEVGTSGGPAAATEEAEVVRRPPAAAATLRELPFSGSG